MAVSTFLLSKNNSGIIEKYPYIQYTTVKMENPVNYFIAYSVTILCIKPPGTLSFTIYSISKRLGEKQNKCLSPSFLISILISFIDLCNLWTITLIKIL